MFFQAEVLVPANTPASDPVVHRMQVQPGVVRQVWVMFPPGPYGLCYVQIWHWGWQVWPWTPGEAFHWDDYVFTFEDRYPIRQPPYELVVKAWNLDDSYDHTVTVALTIDAAPPQEELEQLYTALVGLGLLRG